MNSKDKKIKNRLKRHIEKRALRHMCECKENQCCDICTGWADAVTSGKLKDK